MNYEEITALDNEALDLLQPDDNDTTDDYLDDDNDVDSYDDGNENEYSEEDEYADEQDESDEEDDDSFEAIEVDGETYTIDEIMEWKKGNMRQADYTRKTQELARQREELKELQELKSYLQANPNLVTDIKNGYKVESPFLSNIANKGNDMQRDLFYRVKSMEIDRELDNLKSKYGEIDEVALFNKAAELKTEDLESVYKMLAYDTSNSKVDVEAIYEKAKQDLLAELQENKSKVKTSVSTRQGNTRTKSVPLSDEEARIASALGMSASEYAKWKE